MANKKRGGKTAERRLTENYAAKELGPQQQVEPSKRSHGVSRKYNSALRRRERRTGRPLDLRRHGRPLRL